MSGGAFDYNQHHITYIAEAINDYLHHKDLDPPMSPETRAEFATACGLLRRAAVYAQRIDWLLSGDDSEKTFHERLKSDLKDLSR